MLFQHNIADGGHECELNFRGASTVACWSATKDANPAGYSADLFNDGPPLLKLNKTLFKYIQLSEWFCSPYHATKKIR